MVKPTKKSILSKLPMMKLQVAMIFVISYVLEIPRYLETKLEEVTCNGYSYVIWRSTQLTENSVYTILYRSIFTSLLIIYLPLFLTGIMSHFLIKFLIQKRKIRHQLLVPQVLQSKIVKHTSEENITTVLTVIALTYIICMVPVALYPIFRLFLSSSYCGSFLSYFSTTADFVHIVNSAFTFFIYYLNIPMFRTCLREMLQNCFHCKWERKRKIQCFKSSVKTIVVTVSSEIAKSS